jgi:hypothetical protein
MSEPALTGSACEPIPQIQLSYKDSAFLVSPPPIRPGAFEPFELPPLIRSTTDRLALLAENLWLRQRRTAGFLLLLDTKHRRWGYGVPRQRSSSDAACWTADRRDFPQLPPEAFLGGTFQSRVLSAGETPADAPPPKTDGLHLVLQIQEDSREIWTFVTLGGEMIAAEPGALILDDFQGDYDDLVSRLSFV